MVAIVPTITTDDPAVYRDRLEIYRQFAERIHIDVSDGQFAPSKTLNLNQLYWPWNDSSGLKIDLHLMMERPIDWLDQLVSLSPDRIIMHAESDQADKLLPKIFDHLAKFRIGRGLALLPRTAPAEVSELIRLADTVLIFGGRLGYQGGEADLAQLEKVAQIKQINPGALVEWDGGARLENIAVIAGAGVMQIDVGSAISCSADASGAYREIVELANE